MLQIRLAAPALRLLGLAVVAVWSGSTALAVAPNSVEITYRGSISPKCSVIEGPSELSFGKIEAGKVVSLAFGIDCNEPYKVTIESRNGGLMAPASGDLNGFTNLVPYEVRLVVAADDGEVQSGWCGSAVLKSGGPGTCREISSRNKISVKSVASADWRLAPGAQPLIAGRYSDAITITVGPRGI